MGSLFSVPVQPLEIGGNVSPKEYSDTIHVKLNTHSKKIEYITMRVYSRDNQFF